MRHEAGSAADHLDSVHPARLVAVYVGAYGTCAMLPGHALVQVRGALAALVDAWFGTLPEEPREPSRTRPRGSRACSASPM